MWCVGCGVRHLNIPLTDSELQELQEVKGDRTWRSAILEEFGVDDE